MTLNVDSEIGALRRVLLHRPGLEIDRMVPTMMEHLLFDDILDGERARAEHDGFRRLLEYLGVETVLARDLLEDLLEEDAPREELFLALESGGRVPQGTLDRLRTLDPEDLATALVAGVLADRPGDGHLFELL
ncbi:MAG: arginine deiminase family protein, partial [Thermoanaerobaculia bacterium]|nr:arginine deiminase family protein [Thermoanaerobaculia bacterium]